MSPEKAKEFDDYARLCVKLAKEADTPDLREQLIQQAREWMRAIMEQEDAEESEGTSKAG
jgi:DNA primase